MRKLICFVLIFLFFSFTSYALDFYESFGSSNFAYGGGWNTTSSMSLADFQANGTELSFDNTWYVLGNFGGQIRQHNVTNEFNSGVGIGAYRTSGTGYAYIGYNLGAEYDFTSNTDISYFFGNPGINNNLPRTWIDFVDNAGNVKFGFNINADSTPSSYSSECGISGYTTNGHNLYSGSTIYDECVNLTYKNMSGFTQIVLRVQYNDEAQPEYDMCLDDLNITGLRLSNASNELPNVTIEYSPFICYNETLGYAYFNFSITTYDDLDDTIYYAFNNNSIYGEYNGFMLDFETYDDLTSDNLWVNSSQIVVDTNLESYWCMAGIVLPCIGLAQANPYIGNYLMYVSEESYPLYFYSDDALTNNTNIIYSLGLRNTAQINNILYSSHGEEIVNITYDLSTPNLTVYVNNTLTYNALWSQYDPNTYSNLIITQIDLFSDVNDVYILIQDTNANTLALVNFSVSEVTYKYMTFENKNDTAQYYLDTLSVYGWNQRFVPYFTSSYTDYRHYDDTYLDSWITFMVYVSDEYHIPDSYYSEEIILRVRDCDDINPTPLGTGGLPDGDVFGYIRNFGLFENFRGYISGLGLQNIADSVMWWIFAVLIVYGLIIAKLRLNWAIFVASSICGILSFLLMMSSHLIVFLITLSLSLALPLANLFLGGDIYGR